MDVTAIIPVHSEAAKKSPPAAAGSHTTRATRLISAGWRHSVCPTGTDVMHDAEPTGADLGSVDSLVRLTGLPSHPRAGSVSSSQCSVTFKLSTPHLRDICVHTARSASSAPGPELRGIVHSAQKLVPLIPA